MYIMTNFAKYRLHFNILKIHFYSNLIVVSFINELEKRIFPLVFFYTPIMDEEAIEAFFQKLYVETMSTCLAKFIFTNKPNLCEKLWIKVHFGKSKSTVQIVQSSTDICFLLNNVYFNEHSMSTPFDILMILSQHSNPKDACSEMSQFMDILKSMNIIPDINKKNVLLKIQEWYENCPSPEYRKMSLNFSDIERSSLINSIISSSDFSDYINHLRIICNLMM